MKWKELLYGSMATLVVTIAAGIGVYYWTKEPDAKKQEVLAYSLNQVANFSGGATKLGFNIANIQNNGGIAARNVVLKVDFPSAKITDFSVDSSSGITPKSHLIDNQHAEFVFDALVPSESVTIGLLTNLPEVAKIALRSDNSVGTLDRTKEKATSEKKKINKAAFYFIYAIAVIMLIMAYSLYSSSRRARGRLKALSELQDNEHFSPPPSKNNFAFLLLHQGLVSEAELILKNAISLGEDGVYSLSNLALCKAIDGLRPDALSFIRAARFYSVSDHDNAVVTFNEALVHLLSGNKDEFFIKLKDAVALSPEEIRRYCDYTVHLAAVKTDIRYAEVFQTT